MATPAAFLGHGGRLGAARAAWPNAPTPWLDLSTGINPCPYPVPALAPETWSRLPDPESVRALETAAATAFGVEDPARVVAAAGSEALIRLLPRLLDAPPAGRRIAISARTYGGHADAWRTAGARIVEPDDPAADLRVLVNPNNPSGRALSPDQVVDLTDGPLLVDEAFVDVDPAVSVAPLAGAPGHRTPDGPALVRQVPRPGRRAPGFPGRRAGPGGARPPDAGRLARVRSGDRRRPGGLCRHRLGGQTRLRLIEDAARLDALLRQAGFEIAGGTTLFRLARAADAPRRFEVLAQAGILTRPFPWDETLIRFGLPGPSRTGSASPTPWRASDERRQDLNAKHAEAMKALKAERDAMMETKTLEKGLLLVHTGDGKGKSSAGFGMVARHLGWGLQVGVVQYIKGKWKTGERLFFRSSPTRSATR
jgi:cobalamin biosynthetic protein CobC